MNILLEASNSVIQSEKENFRPKASKIRQIRGILSECESEKKGDLIDEYILIVSTEEDVDCPLVFWAKWESHLPGLAKLAKKYLGIQASSAACERMFSKAGHIFSLKRRRISIALFTALTFLKLNEKIL